MAYNKSLELKKIKQKSTTLGNYTSVDGKNYRDFRPGDFVYSRDGITKYLVMKNGSFKRI